MRNDRMGLFGPARKVDETVRRRMSTVGLDLRLIQNEVEDRLSEQLLADHFKAGDVVEVDLNEEGKIMISVPKTAETTSATS